MVTCLVLIEIRRGGNRGSDIRRIAPFVLKQPSLHMLGSKRVRNDTGDLHLEACELQKSVGLVHMGKSGIDCHFICSDLCHRYLAVPT